MSKQQKLAVLIDAENVSHTLIRSILLRAACYGSLIVKRAFADWSRPGMRRFKTVLHHHAIEPVHLFSYTPGLSAMDLVNTGQFDGVCVVSSDSDLTPLAFCLRREGVRVHGFDRSGGMKRCYWSCVAQRTELSRTSAQDEFFPACSTFSPSSRREPCNY